MSKGKKKAKQPAGEPAVLDVLAAGSDWQPADVGGVASADLADLATGRQTQPNPLAAVEYTGNAEADSAAEMEALRGGFAARAKQEAARFTAAVDSEYWVAVCFQSRAQKEAFLDFMGWLQHGDKYLDGVDLARRAGCPLPSSDDLRFVQARPDRALSELALPLEDEPS